MPQQTRNRRAALILWAMLLLPFFAIVVEFTFHVAERVIGLYLEYNNDNRAKLERFVQQEIQVAQAREKVQQLVVTRTERPKPSSRKRLGALAADSGVIRLENGHKLIMSRDRFLKILDRLETLRDALPEIEALKDSPEMETWSRTILTKTDTHREVALYMVDDDNTIVKQYSIANSKFELIDAFGVNNATNAFDEAVNRSYTPQRFFAMLRGLAPEIRDQILDPTQLSTLEGTATRVGISDPDDGTVQVLIEQMMNGRVTLVPVAVSAELLHEIDLALGEAVPPVDVPVDR